MSNEPLWVIVVGLVLGTGGALGGIAALVGSILSRNLGIKANERQARADESEAEDRLLGRWQQAAAADKERADQAELDLERERDYSRMLQDWIWRQKPPPPPQRPTYKERRD